MARVRSARPRRFEWQRADGTFIELRTDYMPGGGVVTTYTDVTERKRSEETVVKLSRAVEQTADIVMMCARDGTIEYVNPAFEAVTGYAHGEVVGRTPRLLKSGRHDAKFYQQMWQTMLAGRAYRGVLTNSRKDGTLYYEAKTITPVKDETGTVVNFISTGTDITEQRQTEEALRRTESQLQQNQKMEAVGRLAGGVAHDFNNLLTVILGRSAMLLEDRAPDDPARRALELIERTAERAAGLTHQLLAFSRRQVLQPRILDLNPIVSGMAGMLRRLIGEDVELVMDLSPGLGVVRADPGQLEQIVMNLAVNARDAMPRGGRLVISTENVPGAASQRGYVVLKVSDTGVGMDTETQEHIFEPFFTTKEMGKGTGLGLATVHGIMEQHGGTVHVDSAPDRGTTFTLAFPVVEGVPEEPTATPKLVAPSRGSETILLVEDEAAIRSLAREILEANGYVVLEAGDGATALDRCARHEGPIHLVLTDVVMPAISGPDLARRVKAARPDVKILYISGYTAEKLDHHGVFGGEVALLEKPFTPAMLMAKIREVLG
jgi:PAS domain S-box-containing protein